MYFHVKGKLHGVKLLSGMNFNPFIGTFRIFSAQKCCQNLPFLFRGKVYYSTFCDISTIFNLILNGILGKMNDIYIERTTVARL